MRISAPQEKLSAILSRSQSIVERKSTRPILENLLVEAYDQNLRVSATDLRVSLTQNLACTVERPGAISLPARKLHEIVREMPKGDVTAELGEDQWVTLSSGKSIFHLPGTPPEEYPSLPSTSSEYLRFSAPLFRRMIETTLFAAANDESRIFLTGVFFLHWTREDGTLFLRMVATDGHRLSLIDRPVQGQISNLGAGVIVPKKGLAELKGLLDGVEGDFLLVVDEGRFFSQVDGCTISVTLIDSPFPNYEQVIPTGIASWIDIDRADLLNALRRVAILSDDETRTVLMETREDQVVLSSDNQRMGDAREEIEIQYSGEPMKMAFNAQYVQDVLRVLDGERVRIGVSEPLAPCLIRPADDADYLSVVMPMRID